MMPFGRGRSCRGLAAAGALLALGSCQQSSPPRPAPLIGGIQINEPKLDRWITAVRRSGLNTVSTTVYAKQEDWDAARIASDAKLAPVRAEIEAAKRAGLRVVLILRVALDHAYERNRFLWHGMVSPRTDDQVDEWFERYSAFVLRWARLAETTGVDVLGIGSELNRMTSTRPVDAIPALEAWYLNREEQAQYRRKVLSFGSRITAVHRAALGGGDFADTAAFLDARAERWRRWAETTAFQSANNPIAEINRRRRHHEQQWRQLIRRVRAVYRGQLTYAANFDQYREVTFWDALDVIGINAYFELRADLSTAGLQSRLGRAWRRVFDEITSHRRREGLTKPVLFTELGYTNRRHSTVRPWAQSGFEIVNDELVIWEDQPRTLPERAAALEALRQVAQCQASGLLAGVLYWKLSSWPDQQPIEPFAIILGQDDPAEEVLRTFLEPARCP